MPGSSRTISSARAHPLGDFGRGRLPLLQPEGDVALDAEMGKERVALEHHRDAALVGPLVVHHPPQQTDLAAVRIGLLETGEQPQGGGLAASRGSQDGEELAPADLQGDPIHGRDLAEGLGYADQLDDGSRGRRGSGHAGRSSQDGRWRVGGGVGTYPAPLGLSRADGVASPVGSAFVSRMQAPVPATAAEELHAALLQAGLTAALAVLCAFLSHRYRKPYFAWWAAAWALYVVRIGAITSFLLSGNWIWLYWHQVVTGWTALALLYAALVFAQRVRWRSVVPGPGALSCRPGRTSPSTGWTSSSGPRVRRCCS